MMKRQSTIDNTPLPSPITSTSDSDLSLDNTF
ncbi:unnamed protein product, partial [Rotaria magnacalcarata]